MIIGLIIPTFTALGDAPTYEDDALLIKQQLESNWQTYFPDTKETPEVVIFSASGGFIPRVDWALYFFLPPSSLMGLGSINLRMPHVPDAPCFHDVWVK